MENKKIIEFEKTKTLKTILEGQESKKDKKEENPSNSNELTLKSVELYEPFTYDQILNLNKKKYRNLKINLLKTYLEETTYNLMKAIELYKELYNRTEFWEGKSTYDFNFNDWNTIKKANGKLTRYYNDIKKIEWRIKNENRDTN